MQKEGNLLILPSNCSAKQAERLTFSGDIFMKPIICISGISGSGKTTLVEKLIPELISRGYRVASVKHDAHRFEIDKEGKDSWRHKQAGSRTVVLASPEKVAVIRDLDRDMGIDELVDRYVEDVDIVVAEGFKGALNPKVEVWRKAASEAPVLLKDPHLLAVATDDKEIDLPVPRIDINDVKGVADLIEEKVLRGAAMEYFGRVNLYVNGRRIPMKDFVQDFVAGAILGMASSLKGVEGPIRELSLRIEEHMPTKLQSKEE